MIEQTVAGKYDLEEELGAGTLAVVYQALDRESGQTVALKLFNKNLCEDENTRQALLDQAHRVAELEHPAIARVLDAGISDGQVYVATELARGGSLRTLLNSADRLIPEEALKLAGQMAEALEVAHAHGVVHGDLRPENVLLDERGDAKLTDFGWADLLEASGVVAPSQFLSRAAYQSLRKRAGVGPQGDVYLLAALLYEALAGKKPPTLPGKRPPAAYSPKPYNPAVPRWLERVLANGLGDDLSQRYRHATALRVALQAPQLAAVPTSVSYSLAHARRGPTLGRIVGGLGGFFLRLLAVSLPAVVGGVIVAAVLTTYFVGKAALAGPVVDLSQVSAPSFVGMSYEAASEQAASLGITIARNSERPTPDRPKNAILSQWPAPGTTVRKGTVVRVAVSSGLLAPGIVGKTLDDARNSLVASGWQVGIVTDMPTLWSAPGTVVAQSPAPNDVVADKGPIRLTVAVMPPNIAKGQPVQASKGTNPQAVVDDSLDTYWSADGLAPAWIEINLGGPHTIQRIELVAKMKPDGWAGHEIWVVDAQGKEQKVYTFGGEFKDGQVLSQTFQPGIPNIVKIRIVTIGDVSYPGWREIRVY